MDACELCAATDLRCRDRYDALRLFSHTTEKAGFAGLFFASMLNSIRERDRQLLIAKIVDYAAAAANGQYSSRSTRCSMNDNFAMPAIIAMTVPSSQMSASEKCADSAA